MGQENNTQTQQTSGEESQKQQESLQSLFGDESLESGGESGSGQTSQPGEGGSQGGEQGGEPDHGAVKPDEGGEGQPSGGEGEPGGEEESTPGGKPDEGQQPPGDQQQPPAGQQTQQQPPDDSQQQQPAQTQEEQQRELSPYEKRPQDMTDDEFNKVFKPFTLSQKEAEKLFPEADEETVKTFKEVLNKAVTNAVSTARYFTQRDIGALYQQIQPGLMSAEQVAAQQAVQSFYSKNPDLQQHDQLVREVAETFDFSKHKDPEKAVADKVRSLLKSSGISLDKRVKTSNAGGQQGGKQQGQPKNAEPATKPNQLMTSGRNSGGQQQGKQEKSDIERMFS